jgi:hypothetical protein
MLSRNYPLLRSLENPLIAGGLQRIGCSSLIGKNVTTEFIVMIFGVRTSSDGRAHVRQCGRAFPGFKQKGVPW